MHFQLVQCFPYAFHLLKQLIVNGLTIISQFQNFKLFFLIKF